MGLKPGQCNNRSGRPKGSKNILSKELKDILKKVLDKELRSLPRLLKELQPRDRVQAIIKLLDYALPKAVEDDLSSEQEEEKGYFHQFIDKALVKLSEKEESE